ncbi:hypothetical protein C4D60_Mb10t01110 [Musa balbisiana]|uniref:Uncharacterized protein n=1 Tax=Musa balbisiana TaxID=52838 RepID=A0A4S8ITX6_MUSBA|nr:hypothetical protein C4D60_Mb10t01110 [Musa balbisiana]
MPPQLPPFAKENAAVVVAVDKETVSPLELGRGCDTWLFLQPFLSRKAEQTAEFKGGKMDGRLFTWENAKEPLLHHKHYILKQCHVLFAEKYKKWKAHIINGEGGRGGGGVRERYRALSPFADGEEAAACTVLRGKRRSDKSSTEEDAAAAAAFRQGKRRVVVAVEKETVSPLHLGHGSDFEDAVLI